FDSLEVLVEHLSQRHLASADPLRKEPALLDLVLALLVDLARESFRADAFPMALPVLVEVLRPPNAGALWSFDDAALPKGPPITVVFAHDQTPRTAHRQAHPAPELSAVS